MNDKRLATVYQIKNRITGSHYVGCTLSVVGVRWAQHIKLLKTGEHPVRDFQEAWNYSEPSDWDFRIIETDIPLDRRYAKEVEWQKRLLPSLGMMGIVSRQIISEQQKEKVLSLIKEGKSYREISKECNVSLGWISKLKSKFS